MDKSEAVEAVRLVVWDLDDTLWRGTLDDLAVVQHVDAHYDIIRELNRRGIMSSVCSKNDFDMARKALRARGIWDELIFPSIDWTPKGPRLVELVSAVQLRPESVLFIDDNNTNLAEAQSLLWGIQVAGPSIISGLLEDHRLRGGCDPACRRLAHYKALELRHVERVAAHGDNQAFLRGSNIEVFLDYDVDTNIDRAVELINRTNQLNFTKLRLPEDLELAREELRVLISRFDVTAALVRVKDCYGDHGYCGIYVVEGAERWAKLRHFCFSCRIIGMGVEQKIYALIGRPQMDIVGDVISDVKASSSVDWISVRCGEGDLDEAGDARELLSEVRLRGGCELSAIGHYFHIHSAKIRYETNFVKEHLFFRRDCTANLIEISDDELLPDILHRFACGPLELESRLFDPIEDGALVILSMWGDVELPHYRHKDCGSMIANSLRNMAEDGTNIDSDEIERKFAEGTFSECHRHGIENYISTLKREYEYVPSLEREHVVANHRKILRRLPKNVMSLLLLPSNYFVTDTGALIKYIPSVRYNVDVRELLSEYRNIIALSVDDFVLSKFERDPGFKHFNRIVYYRIYKHILELIAKSRPAS